MNNEQRPDILQSQFYHLILRLAIFLLPCLLIACDDQKVENYNPLYTTASTTTGAVLTFGVMPYHNTQLLHETYAPLVEYLNRNLPDITLTMEASHNYEQFEQKLANRHFDFALCNPYQTINSLQDGYQVFAKMGDDDNFRGLIIVRKDSGIKQIADLKGKIISFPAPTALAATMMPLYYLHTNGLDVNQDIIRLFSSSQESSVMNVFLRKSAAGSVWLTSWLTFVKRNPRIAAQLEVKWETPPLLNLGLVARDDVAAEIVAKMQSLLVDLHTHDEGRQLLAALFLARFDKATNATYQPVHDFMKKYSETIH